MDELDKLKSHWQKNDEAFPKMSEGDIYAMLHKRSSSAVKWILIISILEFVFWGLISVGNSIFEITDYNKLPLFITVMDNANYFIALTFIVLFYLNYRKISTKTPVKDLLDNIIRVRRIVTVYMAYNVAMILAGMLSSLFIIKSQDDFTSSTANIIAIGIIIIVIFMVLIAGVYYLLYGRLVRKLNKNYKELKKISGQ
ncbi:hypothetical protein ACLI08_12085 [Flavobacterium sp. RNTU_13]|uniref:hypothetical protein n=1 Tax=Flavobacterium sp. RNTU_13 TaxID=3375145 RepID=UPI003986A975